jgi:hypothetical protein
VPRIQKGIDLVRVGDQISLPPELMVGTVLLIRGGDRDGTAVRHWDDSGWTVDGGTGELLAWFEVFRLAMTAPGVILEVTQARQRCGWPLCKKGGWLPVDPAPDQVYCGDACRQAAARDRRRL